jgi:Zn-dependent protease
MPDPQAELEQAAADLSLTRSAREVLERAVNAAKARGANVTPSDVLQATLSSKGTPAYEAIKALGIDSASIAAQLPAAGMSTVESIPLRQLLVNANREAQVLGHYQVDSIHLLLALLYTDSRETSAPLQKAGLTLYDVRRHLQSGTKVDFQPGESDRMSGNRVQPQRARTDSARTSAVARADAALRRKPWPPLRGAVNVSPVFSLLIAITAITGVVLWTGLLPQFVGPLTILFVTAGWITSVCVHEFGHAVVAYMGGDTSVHASGYLDLNPLRYTNVLLSLVMPVLFLLLGGIGLPGGAVYIDRGALRSRVWDSAVSVAGPAGTLLCALLIAIPFLIPGHRDWITSTNQGFFLALGFLGFIEVIALVLNLLPVPGLDGFGIIRPWLPHSVQGLANQYGQLGILAVFALLWFVPAVRDTFFPFVLQLTGLLGIDPATVILGQLNMRFLPIVPR